ncbi:MAG TPA: BlaI/MecI/CopY family transcriptional regulator [Pirellulaceae bacterium]|nr:BlaI/MecI/CopY family transcriptional regulator [Pirellulaceae bacterium]
MPMEIVPSERELQALKVLWQAGEATVREITAAINEQGESLAYTTVLSLLQVMEQKGLVSHRASGKFYLYFARVRKGPTVRALARGFLDRVFDGAVDEYLVHALEAKRPSDEEIRRLEELVAQAKHGRHAARTKRKSEGLK